MAVARDYFPGLAFRRPELRPEHLAGQLGGRGTPATVTCATLTNSTADCGLRTAADQHYVVGCAGA